MSNISKWRPCGAKINRLRKKYDPCVILVLHKELFGDSYALLPSCAHKMNIDHDSFPGKFTSTRAYYDGAIAKLDSLRLDAFNDDDAVADVDNVWAWH